MTIGSPQPSMVLAADADPERAQLVRDQLIRGHDRDIIHAA